MQRLPKRNSSFSCIPEQKDRSDVTDCLQIIDKLHIYYKQKEHISGLAILLFIYVEKH